MPARNSAAPAKNSKVRAPRSRLAPPAKPPRAYDWWLWAGRPTFEGACEALAFQYAVLDELVQPLLAGDWRDVARRDRRRAAVRLTRLTAIAEEVVAATREAPGPPSELDAVDWFRRGSTSSATEAEGQAEAQADAGRPVRTGIANIAAQHRAATATAIAVLRSGEADLILGGPAQGLELAEFTVTRLVAAVVHGLDLAQALGRPGHADPVAVNLVSGFLAAVAERGGEPGSAPIAVDGQGSLITLAGERHKARIPAVDWIQASTGRRPADQLLPHTHAWLAAELPLVA